MAKKEEINNISKLEALQETIKKIEKEYGSGAVMRLDEAPVLDIDVIPSGSLTLDIALGVGGYPRGRQSFGQKLAYQFFNSINQKNELLIF